MYKLISKTLYFLVLLIFILRLTSYKTHSQSYYIDSLINYVYEQNDDTNKVDNLIAISRQLSGIDKVKSIAYGDMAINISGQLGYDRGMSGAFFAKGIVYWKSGDIDSAKVYLDKAIKTNESLNNFSHLAQNYEVYGLLYIRLNKPDSAITKLKESLYYFNQSNDSAGIVGIYNSFGLLFKSIGEYDSAVYYHVKSLSLCKLINNENLLCVALINLGNIHLHLIEYENAEKYYLESISYCKRINRLDHLANVYKSLGIISSTYHNYKEAFEYYRQSHDLYNQLNDPDGLASLYIAFGNSYEEQTNYNKAFEYYSKAIELAEEITDVDALIVALLNKALIYQRWSSYSKALNLLDSCLIMILKTSDIEKLKSVYFNFYKTYEFKKDYKNAFIYQTKYNEINDSIFNIEKAEVITDLTLKYEKEKDQARILALEKETLEKEVDLRKHTNQRNIYLFAGSGIIVIIFFLFIFYRHKSRKDKIIADQKIKQLEEEKKLLAAKFLVEGQEEERKRIAQELHDGLGVLLSTTKMQFTTIKDKSPENKPIIEKATKLLEQATGDVRNISHNMMPGLLTRFGFYEATEDLLDKVNETEGLNADVKIAGDTKRLPENTEIMLYRITQEMVNNTLKHAKANNILLDINIQPETINIQYSDDGKGFDVEEKFELKSIGLQSIQSRVSFLNGKLKIESQKGEGSKYILEIPSS